MPARRPIAVALCAAALLAGCGSEDEVSTPAACFATGDDYLAALETVPGDAEIGGTALGECLPPGQSAGDLAEVGAAMIAAAGRLSADARDGDAEAALRLGYLVGLAEARAEQSSVHADFALRLASEQNGLDAGSPQVPEALAEGLEAGRAAA